MSKFDFGKLSDEDLDKVVGGMSYAIEGASIVVTLDAGESASAALSCMSLPFGLKLDSDSSALLINVIAPAMGTTGPRNVSAQYTLRLPYIHIDNYTLY